jgi:DNA-binding transcriptional ArsR family regulator
MVEQPTPLDRTFAALADPTRRAILARLRTGTKTIGALAEPFDISLAGVSKHVQILERAGLIRRQVRGREHRCRLRTEPLRAAARWAAYLAAWEERLDGLEELLASRAGGGRARRTRR